MINVTEDLQLELQVIDPDLVLIEESRMYWLRKGDKVLPITKQLVQVMLQPQKAEQESPAVSGVVAEEYRILNNVLHKQYDNRLRFLAGTLYVMWDALGTYNRS